PEFIASLPKYSLPNLPKQGTFRIFPTEGESMLPIPENSDVTGEYVEDWYSIKPKTPCIVILKNNQDFVFKLVTFQKDRTFLLESMNPIYKPYTVAPNEVLEIWKFHSFTSKQVPEAVSDLTILLQEIKSLKEEVRSVRNNLI